MSYPMSYPTSASYSSSYSSSLQSKDPALFVYLAWGTRGGTPHLACDQVRQAVYLAITIRLRSQFCHVMSIGGTADQVHLIVRFPASLPVSTILRMAQDAAGDAAAHRLETFEGRSLERKMLWERQYTTRTLCLPDADDAHAYLRRQILDPDR